MRRIAQGEAYTVMMKLFDSTDHVTAKTGSTVAITLSKAGAAFGNPAAGASNATEVSNGWYKFALGTGDTDTLCDLVIRGTASGADATEQVMQVVSATTGGASNLDAAVSSRSSHAAADVWAVGTRSLTVLDEDSTTLDLDATIRAAVGLASANLDTQVGDLPTNSEFTAALAGADDATLAAIAALNNLSAAQVRTELGTELGRIDVAVSTRMETYTQPTGFLAATFPSDPADQSLVIAATDALAALIGNVPTNSELVAALGTADDATLAAIAALSIPTANENADALLDRANGVETGLTPRGALRLIAAALAGKLSGGGTNTNTIRNAVADSKNRIVATVTDDGDRTAITTDVT